MPPKVSADSKFEIGHVLFIDIVGYSKLLIEEQKERLADLTKIVLGTAQVRDSTDEQLVRLPTGDGWRWSFVTARKSRRAARSRFFSRHKNVRTHLINGEWVAGL